MEWAWVWESFFLIFAGMALLRVAGRKSIAQTTVATTVIMISIGTTFVQPIGSNDLWKAVGSAVIFVGSLLLTEYLEMKLNWIEKLTRGQAIIVIDNGQIIPEHLHSLRLTVDQLETMLRQNGISNIGDVKTATFEPNGQLGYELMRHAKPVTIGDLEAMLGLQPGASLEQSALFQEIRHKRHPSPIDPRLE